MHDPLRIHPELAETDEDVHVPIPTPALKHLHLLRVAEVPRNLPARFTRLTPHLERLKLSFLPTGSEPLTLVLALHGFSHTQPATTGPSFRFPPSLNQIVLSFFPCYVPFGIPAAAAHRDWIGNYRTAIRMFQSLEPPIAATPADVRRDVRLSMLPIPGTAGLDAFEGDERERLVKFRRKWEVCTRSGGEAVEWFELDE